MKLDVYVPIEGTAAIADIPRGSAVVGQPGSVRNGRMLVTLGDAGGGRLGIRGFMDAIRAAAALHVDQGAQASTGRLRLVDVGHVVKAAVYDTETASLSSVAQPASLADWSGENVNAMSTERGPRGFPSFEEVADSIRQGRRVDLLDDSPAYLTRSGQVVRLSVKDAGFELMAENDPRLPVDYQGPSGPRP